MLTISATTNIMELLSIFPSLSCPLITEYTCHEASVDILAPAMSVINDTFMIMCFSLQVPL